MNIEKVYISPVLKMIRLQFQFIISIIFDRICIGLFSSDSSKEYKAAKDLVVAGVYYLLCVV